MKLLHILIDYIRKPIWFILFIISLIYICFITINKNTAYICNLISLLASIFTLITAGSSIYAYNTINNYKKNKLRKFACETSITILQKIVSSVEESITNKRNPDSYLNDAKRYIEDIVKENNLKEAFGTNYNIIMDMEKLNLHVKDTFINACNAIINIYNESEKL